MARNGMNPKMRIRRLRVERLECRRVLAGIVSGAFEEMLVTRHDSHNDHPALEGTLSPSASETNSARSDRRSDRITNSSSQQAATDRPSVTLEFQNSVGKGSQSRSTPNNQSRGPWSYSPDRQRDEREDVDGEGEQVVLPPPQTSPAPNANAGPSNANGSRSASGAMNDGSGSVGSNNRGSIDARLTPNGSLNLSPPAFNSDSTSSIPPSNRTVPFTPPSAAANPSNQGPQQTRSAEVGSNEVFFDLGAMVQSGAQDIRDSLGQSLEDGLTDELTQARTGESSSLSSFQQRRNIALDTLLSESDPLGLEETSRTNNSIDSLLRDLLPPRSLQSSADPNGAQQDSSVAMNRHAEFDLSRGDSTRVDFGRNGADRFTEQLGKSDGMIALRLPVSLLPTNVVAKDSQETTVWSLPLGASSDSMELLAVSGQAVTPRAGLSDNGAERAEKSDSTLRPVLAATTAALGVLYVGRRRQQRADEQERKQSEQLN